MFRESRSQTEQIRETVMVEGGGNTTRYQVMSNCVSVGKDESVVDTHNCLFVTSDSVVYFTSQWRGDYSSYSLEEERRAVMEEFDGSV
ncbi:hypothetical protein Tco_0728290 [Tanacetum coccineum]|uniref:Uncharacterized protein n=1 Tax=Tanacetum coccineum TaxID=301880 RepID=A0ABQ4YKR0_9ASTR